jgi:hypothetical protein
VPWRNILPLILGSKTIYQLKWKHIPEDLNLQCHSWEDCNINREIIHNFAENKSDSVGNLVWEVVLLMWYCSIHSKWTQTAVELWHAWHCQVWVYGSPCRTLQSSGSSMQCHMSHCARWMWHLQLPKCWPVSIHYSLARGNKINCMYLLQDFPQYREVRMYIISTNTDSHYIKFVWYNFEN